MNLPANLPWFDIIVLGILLFSLLLGLMRGFVEEVLTMFNWVGAALVAWFFYPQVAELLVEWLPNDLIRKIAGGILCFVGAIITLSFLSSFLKAMLSFMATGSIDRALGGMFGLLRGYIVASLLFGAVYWIWDDRQPPALMREGKTRPFIAVGAREVMTFLADSEDAPLIIRLREIAESGSTALELHEKILSPETEKKPDISEESIYKDTQRQELDKLFE